MKKIIVTGASSGIGYQTVKSLTIEHNCEVIAIARNINLLHQLKSEVVSENANAKIHVIPYDLSEQDLSKLMIQLERVLKGSLDVLINNAGAIVNKPFLELTQNDFSQVYEVNLFAVVRLIQGVFPSLRKKGGHIINISSMGGVQGSSKFAGLSAYSSSKGALSCLTECLAEEFKEENVSVNALALGAVQTEMLENAFPGYQAPLSAEQMGAYVASFALAGNTVYNGKILPVSVSTP